MLKEIFLNYLRNFSVIVLIKNLINFILKSFNRFGLDIDRRKIVNFNENFDSSNLNSIGTNIIINYQLKDLITTAGQRMGSDEDPYYFALKNSIHLKKREQFIDSFVNSIKQIIKSPRTASEAIGKTESLKLSSYPEWALVKPWEDKSIDKIYKTYLKNFVSKREKLKKLYQSSNEKNNIIYNNLAWESHAEQFFDLYQSISNNGFKEDNLISVNLFKYRNDYKCSLSDDGNHRIRIAYILGIKTIPFKISKVVDFNDIKNWANVKNELYSLNDAKKIFTDYFNYSGKGAYV